VVGERAAALVKKGAIYINKGDKLDKLISDLNKLEKSLVELKDERGSIF